MWVARLLGVGIAYFAVMAGAAAIHQHDLIFAAFALVLTGLALTPLAAGKRMAQ